MWCGSWGYTIGLKRGQREYVTLQNEALFLYQQAAALSQVYLSLLVLGAPRRGGHNTTMKRKLM
jgi:hypothetical protein